MNAANILAGLQLIRFLTEQVELYGRGLLTDEEYERELARIGTGIDRANDLWDRAGMPP